MKKYLFLILTVSFGAALVLAGEWSFLVSRHPFPPPNAIREVRQSAVGDALALSLGLRRLAADL